MVGVRGFCECCVGGAADSVLLVFGFVDEFGGMCNVGITHTKLKTMSYDKQSSKYLVLPTCY
mgnify:CR=1 FL=1